MSLKSIFSNKNSFRVEWAIFLIIIFCSLWAYYGSQEVFPNFSSNADEAVYVQQASNYLKDKSLYRQIDELTPFEKTFWQVVYKDKVYFKYNPVHALTLLVGRLLFGDFKFSLVLIYGLFGLILFMFFKEFNSDKKISLRATMIGVFSPIIMIQSLTYLPYLASLNLVLLSLICLIRGIRKNSRLLLILSGIIVGVYFLSRPYDAILLSITVLLAYVLSSKENCPKLSVSIPVLLGFLPLFILTLIINYILTENLFQFPFNVIRRIDSLGFKDEIYTPSIALGYLGQNLYYMTWALFGGVLLIPFVLIGIRKQIYNDWKIKILIVLLISFPIGYLFFWGSGNSLYRDWEFKYSTYYYLPMVIPVSYFSAIGITYFQKKSINLFVILMVVLFTVSFIKVNHMLKHNSYASTFMSKTMKPLQTIDLSKSLVFVKTEMLLHPFSATINDKGSLFLLDLGEKNFFALEKFKKRKPWIFESRLDLDNFLKDPEEYLKKKNQIEMKVIPIEIKNCLNCKIEINLNNIYKHKKIRFDLMEEGSNKVKEIEKWRVGDSGHRLILELIKDRLIYNESKILKLTDNKSIHTLAVVIEFKDSDIIEENYKLKFDLVLKKNEKSQDYQFISYETFASDIYLERFPEKAVRIDSRKFLNITIN